VLARADRTERKAAGRARAVISADDPPATAQARKRRRSMERARVSRMRARHPTHPVQSIAGNDNVSTFVASQEKSRVEQH
jgi:hypothetical protein